MAKDFTHNDYFSAATTRHEDCKHLRTRDESIIFSVYCVGVAIECIFRAYITRYTKEFDSKHNMYKLYEKSLLSQELNSDEKEKVNVAVKKVNDIWNNDLRYVSEKRLKRKIAHEFLRTSFSDINKYYKKINQEVFEAAELIIKTGEEKWT